MGPATHGRNDKREGKQTRSENVSKSQSGCLELTDTASVRPIYARPSQIALLEEDARTKVRRHGAAKAGVVRNRQGLHGTRENAGYSLPQIVVVQVELSESGEGRDGCGDRVGERVGGEVTVNPIEYQQIVDSTPSIDHVQNKQGTLQGLTSRQTVDGIRQPLVFDDQALQR